MNTGDKVQVAATTIQRSNGAAWRGDTGTVIAVTGDGYRIRFASGFIAENVKDHEITNT
jgi:ribosomal protein L21E